MKKKIIGLNICGINEMLESAIDVSEDTLVYEKEHLKEVFGIKDDEPYYLIFREKGMTKHRIKVIKNNRRKMFKILKQNIYSHK